MRRKRLSGQWENAPASAADADRPPNTIQHTPKNTKLNPHNAHCRAMHGGNAPAGTSSYSPAARRSPPGHAPPRRALRRPAPSAPPALRARPPPRCGGLGLLLSASLSAGMQISDDISAWLFRMSAGEASPFRQTRVPTGDGSYHLRFPGVWGIVIANEH